MTNRMRHAMMVGMMTLAFLAALPAIGEEAAAPGGAPHAAALGWRLGCQAWSFNRFTLFETIDKVQSLGLHTLEAFPGQKLSPEQPDVTFDHNASKEVLDAVKAKLAAADIQLANYGVVGLPNDEAGCRKVFEFAKTMGIETICSEPSGEAFDLIDALCQEYGINVAIHNHPKPSRYWSPDKVLEVCEGRSKRIGVCCDTGHWMRSGVEPLEALKKLEGRIISFHFKNLNEATRHGHDTPWGEGVGDVKAWLAEVKRQGVRCVFSIEYEHNWDNSVPDIAQCVAYFDQVAKELAEK